MNEERGEDGVRKKTRSTIRTRGLHHGAWRRDQRRAEFSGHHAYIAEFVKVQGAQLGVVCREVWSPHGCVVCAERLGSVGRQRQVRTPRFDVQLGSEALFRSRKTEGNQGIFIMAILRWLDAARRRCVLLAGHGH